MTLTRLVDVYNIYIYILKNYCICTDQCLGTHEDADIPNIQQNTLELFLLNGSLTFDPCMLYNNAPQLQKVFLGKGYGFPHALSTCQAA